MVNNCVRDRIEHSEELKHIHSGIVLSSKKYGFKSRERLTVVSAYSKVRKAFDKNILQKAVSNPSNHVTEENNEVPAKNMPTIYPRGLPSALPKQNPSILPNDDAGVLPNENSLSGMIHNELSIDVSCNDNADSVPMDISPSSIDVTTQIVQPTSIPETSTKSNNAPDGTQVLSMSDILFSSPSVQLFRETKPEMFAKITGQNATSAQNATSGLSGTANRTVGTTENMIPSSTSTLPDLANIPSDDVTSNEHMPTSPLHEALHAEKVNENEDENETTVPETVPRQHVETLRAVQEKVYRKSTASFFLSMASLSEETNNQEQLHQQNERRFSNVRRRDDSRDRYSSRYRGKETSRSGDRDYSRSRDRSKDSRDSRGRSRKDECRSNNSQSLPHDSCFTERVQKRFNDLENVYKDKYNINTENEERGNFAQKKSKLRRLSGENVGATTNKKSKTANQLAGTANQKTGIISQLAEDIPFLESSQDETDDQLIIDTGEFTRFVSSK